MNGLRYSLRVGLAAGLALAETTVAQTYPSQQVRMVVGYAAGGGADGLIRAIAPELGEVLGQSVVIDNRGGGGTVIGTHIVAASKPDGYTFYVADNAYIVNPALMSKLPSAKSLNSRNAMPMRCRAITRCSNVSPICCANSR